MELVARGHDRIVLAGRDEGGLRALANRPGPARRIRTASLDDPAALRAVVDEDVCVMINCAGPFTRSGPPLATTAVAAGCRYLDHPGEPLDVRALFDTLGVQAADRGSVVIPGMSFYGAVADLLAESWPQAGRRSTR